MHKSTLSLECEVKLHFPFEEYIKLNLKIIYIPKLYFSPMSVADKHSKMYPLCTYTMQFAVITAFIGP